MLKDNDVFMEWNGKDGFAAAGRRDETQSEISKEDEARIAGQPWRTVISADGWKLNLSPVDQRELYDLNSDPFESTNLFDDASQRHRIQDLSARIRYWQGHTSDNVHVMPNR
jgi:arylsulfatase A-like enzyme